MTKKKEKKCKIIRLLLCLEKCARLKMRQLKILDEVFFGRSPNWGKVHFTRPWDGKVHFTRPWDGKVDFSLIYHREFFFADFFKNIPPPLRKSVLLCFYVNRDTNTVFFIHSTTCFKESSKFVYSPKKYIGHN